MAGRFECNIGAYLRLRELIPNWEGSGLPISRSLQAEVTASGTGAVLSRLALAERLGQLFSVIPPIQRPRLSPSDLSDHSHLLRSPFFSAFDFLFPVNSLRVLDSEIFL